VDDWAMAPLQETERRDFWEICEERYQTRPTILTSRFPSPAGTNSSVTLPIADGILDRLVHNAHRIELRGESMRKTRGKKQIRSRSPKGFYTNWGREKDSCAVPSSALHPARKKERRNTGV
jgi:hypothetical protein